MRHSTLLLFSIIMLTQAVPSPCQSESGGKPLFGRLPPLFVENGGQYPPDVSFVLHGSDKSVYFTSKGLTLALVHSDKRWVIKLDFVGCRNGVRPHGEDRQQAVVNHFRGSPDTWKTGISTYARIVYPEVWPGVDVVFTGMRNKLKYAFIVKPGADPGKICLAYRGVSRIQVTEAGNLVASTPAGDLEDAKPIAYQEVNGKKLPVEVSFSPDLDTGDDIHRIFFSLGEYDPEMELVIDPTVIMYCGYIGGSGMDHGHSIAVDTAGNAYVAGWTKSSQVTFPDKVGPDLTYNGDWDGFVAKVNASGTGLVYCGYIGGSGSDQLQGIEVDSAGYVYLTGRTGSTEATFPVTVGPDLTHNGSDDAFVAKLNPAGTSLVYCGYIGGTSGDAGFGIAIDGSGSAFVAGYASSNEKTFPVAFGPDLTHNGSSDCFVAKVNPAGTGLIYCGYIGGSGSDGARSGVAVDRVGNAYVTSATNSTEQTFPVKVGPDTTYNGGEFDCFVARVNAKGTALDYCGYIGGSAHDRGEKIKVDSKGAAYLCGHTTSSNLPTVVGPDLTFNGHWEAFVAKVNPTGKSLDYCGYIGGADTEVPYDIALDTSGHAYVVGHTRSNSSTFPVKGGPGLTQSGISDVFVARVNRSGSALDYCGYIGGQYVDEGFGIAVDGAGSAYLTGRVSSNSSTFPVKVGPDLSYNGGDMWMGDAFVAKVIHQSFFYQCYGKGKQGSGLFTPLLSASGIPNIGALINLHVSGGIGAGGSMMIIGPAPANLPALGGTLLVVPGFYHFFFLSGQPNIPGTGMAAVPILIPNDVRLKGVTLYAQTGIVDPGVAYGLSMTNGLECVIQ